MQAQKKECRNLLIGAPDNRDAHSREDDNRKITANVLDMLNATNVQSVFVYISIGNEVPTHALIDQLLTKGIMVSVPRLIDRQIMIAVEFPSWQNLRPGALGILAPQSSSPSPGPIDTAIVPGLGFSVTGKRIGHGAGYYDRWLAGHPDTRRIGIAYEQQILPQIPTDDHDVEMDVLVTQGGVAFDGG
jgi:5-formyltetrahydrofolate cyclo-ligase